MSKFDLQFTSPSAVVLQQPSEAGILALDAWVDEQVLLLETEDAHA